VAILNHKLLGKDFALVVAGQIVSLFGNAILRFSLPLFLLRETGSPALFGMVTACSLLPVILLSLLGGVLADRVNKRNIMVFLDFSTAGIIAGFYFLVGRVPTIPLFIVTLMLLYGISGTYQPAVQASIPVLVAKDHILTASAVVNQIGSLASLVGPVTGGWLYGLWGMELILKISVVCFAISAVMELFLTIPYIKRPQEKTALQIVRHDLQDSTHFLRFEKPAFLKVCLVIAGLNLFLSSMVTIGVPVMIVEHWGLSNQLLGIAQGLLAAGGVLGGLLTALLGKRLQPERAYVFLILCAMLTLLMGAGMLWSNTPYLKYLILSGTGTAITIFSTMFSIQMLAVVQRETPEHLIGKVIACIMTLIMCAQPIGQLIYGIFLEQISAVPILTGAGAISMCIALYAKKVLSELGGVTGNG
jgi:MFS family permease